MYQKFITKFSSISFNIIMVVCALLPVFFLPGTWGGIGAVKGVLLYGGVFLAFSFWLLAQFVGGSLNIPKHRTLLALGLWIVLALLSALFSKNASVSLWGRGFALDSFATILVLGMFTFLVATFAREQKRLVTLFLAAFVGSVGTVLLQVLLYLSQKVGFVATYLSHVANQGTLIGSWVDFAHFVTLTFLLALLMYEVLMPKGFFKVLSLSAMVLCTLVLIFLNFKAAWIITIVSSLLVFVYKSSVERSVAKFFPKNKEVLETQETSDRHLSDTPRFPIMSFVALLIGLFFLLSSNSIGASISRYAGINFTDIRPSFSATTQVMRSALWRDPILGAGPGRYGDVWNLYHPSGINQTQFWNNTFDSGFSMFQTLFTTNGTLVALAILAVIVLSLLHGFRLFNYQFPDRFSRFIAVAALIMFTAFVGLFIFSSPGIVLVVLGFLYLGLLLGVSTLVGRTPVLSIDYLRDPRLSFFTILLLVLATMGGFTAAYFSGNRFASVMLYNRAITASNIESVQRRMDRALSLSQNDIYWRTRAAIFVRQFTDTANTDSPDKALLQSHFTQAEQSAKAAVEWDSTSANNWLTLSQVYQLVISGEAPESYTAAKSAADEATLRSPKNPLFALNQAQVVLAKKDVVAAKEFIAQAIELKADYLDAYALRAQIRIAEGEEKGAVEELTTYIKNAPFDEQGFLLLGQAHAALKQHQQALDAFTRARQINPNNPNTLLGIIDSFTALGQKTQALEALDVFAQTFPSIQGIDIKKSQIQGSGAVTADTEN